VEERVAWVGERLNLEGAGYTAEEEAYAEFTRGAEFTKNKNPRPR
jgi:hypothetical protein